MSPKASFFLILPREGRSQEGTGCALIVSVSWVPEQVLPSVNIGLPHHLIQCHHPRPAYVTHTAPVVKMLVEQDKWRKAASNCPAETELNREPPEAGLEEETQALSKLSRGGRTPGTGKDSAGMPKADSSLPSLTVRSRVIFARKPPSCALPCSSLACSSKKK